MPLRALRSKRSVYTVPPRRQIVGAGYPAVQSCIAEAGNPVHSSPRATGRDLSCTSIRAALRNLWGPFLGLSPLDCRYSRHSWWTARDSNPDPLRAKQE
jgi:hypothetical protein